jgi:1-acyl-sn-glycerol-3-phosphate acyltransferase
MIKKLMWKVRLCLFYIGIIPATMLIATLGWICAPLPAIWCYKIITSWSHFFIWWSKIICGLKYNVIGKENLPAAPFVVLCNHQSMWETIFMQVLLPPQSWVLKRELLWVPFFGWGLALIKPIAVSRNKLSDIKVILNKGVQRITEGRCVVFYPEGTRMQPGLQRRYSRTGAALAIAAKVPVVPIAHNAGNFWPKGPWIKHPGLITVSIGNAIATDSETTANITAQAEAWINEQRIQMLPRG